VDEESVTIGGVVTDEGLVVSRDTACTESADDSKGFTTGVVVVVLSLVIPGRCKRDVKRESAAESYFFDICT